MKYPRYLCIIAISTTLFHSRRYTFPDKSIFFLALFTDLYLAVQLFCPLDKNRSWSPSSVIFVIWSSFWQSFKINGRYCLTIKSQYINWAVQRHFSTFLIIILFFAFLGKFIKNLTYFEERFIFCLWSGSARWAYYSIISFYQQLWQQICYNFPQVRWK